MKKAFGLPVVTADTIEKYLNSVELYPWTYAKDPMTLEGYIASGLTPEQQAELRFAPKAEVVFLENPHSGNLFTGFRSLGKNWATTFALLPGNLVPVTAEYKHGVNKIVLVPPSGVPSKADAGSMEACARREFTEETGLQLKSIKPLANGEPLAVSGRQNAQVYYPFLGEVDTEAPIGPSKLDQNEHLKLVLVPLQDWLELIERGEAVEDCSASVTYLALRKLGLLALNI